MANSARAAPVSAVVRATVGAAAAAAGQAAVAGRAVAAAAQALAVPQPALARGTGRRAISPHGRPVPSILFRRVYLTVEPARQLLKGCGLRAGAVLAAHQVHDVGAEGAVALELRLVEELVGGRLVREGVVRPLVVEHVLRLLAVDGGLDVDEHAVLRVLVYAGVSDPPDGPVAAAAASPLLAGRVERLAEDGHLLEVYGHAEVNANLADGVAEVFELVVGVRRGIADDDEAAAAQNHLVEREVLEVAAVG